MRRTGILAAAAALVVVVEIGLRVLADPGSAWSLTRSDALRVEPLRFAPHHRFRNGVETNEQGFLAPPGLERARPESALRFVYVGDSISVHPTDANFPLLVESRLEREHGVEIQTLNAAVPGAAAGDALALFRERVVGFAGDLLVVHLGWNDVGQFGPEGLPYKRAGVGYEPPAWAVGLDALHVLRLRHALGDWLRTWTPPESRPLDPRERALYGSHRPRHFARAMGELLRLGKERYGRVLVLNLATLASAEPTQAELARAHFPTGMTRNLQVLRRLVASYNQVLQEVADREGARLVDLHAAFDSRDARAHFVDSCHLDDAGAGIIAREVVRAIGPVSLAGWREDR